MYPSGRDCRATSPKTKPSSVHARPIAPAPAAPFDTAPVGPLRKVLYARPGGCGIPQLLESPRWRSFGRRIFEVPRTYVRVEVTHDIAEEQIIDMTRLEHLFKGRLK
jgi:hypothetical protein